MSNITETVTSRGYFFVTLGGSPQTPIKHFRICVGVRRNFINFVTAILNYLGLLFHLANIIHEHMSV